MGGCPYKSGQSKKQIQNDNESVSQNLRTHQELPQITIKHSNLAVVDMIGMNLKTISKKNTYKSQGTAELA